MVASSHAALPLPSTPSSFPLLTSFLATPLPKELLAPLLAFNNATWRYRKPAQASRLVQTREWLIARVVELAHNLLQSIRPPKRKKPNPASAELSIEEHDVIIAGAGPDTLIIYTDGSASPNPGPAGAGAVVFAQHPNTCYDLGKSMGFSTNNAAEIYALGMIVAHLPTHALSHPC